MNLDRYENISGREALKRLLNDETVFNWCGDAYQIEDGLVIEKTGKGNEFCANLTLNGVIGADGWYILKPFDVRQAMLDRPNEWVGAIECGGYWFKIGLDMRRMNVVSTIFKNDVPVLSHHPVVSTTFSLELDNCIPLEDVPEEAPR